MHDNWRRRHDDFVVMFMTPMPVPFAFRNNASCGNEAYDKAGKN